MNMHNTQGSPFYNMQTIPFIISIVSILFCFTDAFVSLPRQRTTTTISLLYPSVLRQTSHFLPHLQVPVRPTNANARRVPVHSSLLATTITNRSDINSTDDIKHNHSEHNHHNFETFQQCLSSMSLPIEKQQEIMQDISKMGFTTCSELYLLGKDFVDRPEALSSLLKADFGLNPVKSHLVRGALIHLVEIVNEQNGNGGSSSSQKGGQGNDSVGKHFQSSKVNGGIANGVQTRGMSQNEVQEAEAHHSIDAATNNNIHKDSIMNGQPQPQPHSQTSSSSAPPPPLENCEKENSKKQPLFKSVVVNQRAKRRKSDQRNYGLPTNYKTMYPKLSQELDDFLNFMTMPTANVQESPIRKATATVYIRHAKLFLGWYRDRIGLKEGEDSLEIRDIFPDKEAKSAQPIIDFILWLRETRQISDSYEANILRGLTKLLKFRYRNESTADPSYGEKSFGDIPVVRELRKLHRDANRRQILSPRSSEEDRKWLDWNEYLNVVRLLKEDVEEEIKKWEGKKSSSKKKSIADGNQDYTPTQRRIATKFQAYLILSFFSCVPDRQRTFRELEIGTTFIRDAQINCWTIKHGPDDYKTGKTYGDRPPLVLAQELTPAIDDFLGRWRNCLKPQGEHFFVQPRTGKAFTQDSVYSLVARSCYKHTGKKTNPHLLRDMIVTHVRDSDASEKELEALALYMGHSISMQRNSYDRRTMEQKVAPAVELLRNVNMGS